jgi:hypothetical protein
VAGVAIVMVVLGVLAAAGVAVVITARHCHRLEGKAIESLCEFV